MTLVVIANANPAPSPCSGKKQVAGNPCGTQVLCTVANCSTYFWPDAGGNKLAAGLPTDNWAATTTLISCGFGGNCKMNQAGTDCNAQLGAIKQTYKLADGGGCVVPP